MAGTQVCGDRRGVFAHLLVLVRVQGADGVSGLQERRDGDAGAVFQNELRNGGLVPDDDRETAHEVQRSLVRVVVLEVRAVVAGAGVDGRAVPDEAEVAVQIGRQFVRQEGAVVDRVRVLVLVADAVELEADAGHAADVLEVPDLVGVEVAGDDEVRAGRVEVRVVGLLIGLMRLEVRGHPVVEDVEGDEFLPVDAFRRQVIDHDGVVRDDEVGRLQHRGLVEALAHTGLERNVRLDEPELLEVVDEEDDRHPSAPQFPEQFPEEDAVGDGRELDDQQVAFPEVREGLFPDVVRVSVLFQRSGDGRIVPLELERDLDLFHPEFGQRELHVRPRLVGRVLEVGVLRFPFRNIITMIVHAVTGRRSAPQTTLPPGESRHPSFRIIRYYFKDCTPRCQPTKSAQK